MDGRSARGRSSAHGRDRTLIAIERPGRPDPAGRRGDPSEIAQAVVFLASDEAAFTVGSELIIDGGMSTL
jgi:NAD(P)-dependent dehydrogenase (short-subunit alcohol dehydrogenase family)